MIYHRCSKEEKKYFLEDHIQEFVYSWLWYPTFFNIIRIAWLFHYSSFACFTKLLFCVCLLLNLWKVEIVSGPYKYLLLVVGFYKRSVLFFLYWFQFSCYINDNPITRTISWCIRKEGVWIVNYKYHRFKTIFMAHGVYNTEVELESLRETGVGGLIWWKPLKRSRLCWLGETSMMKNLKRDCGLSLKSLVEGNSSIWGVGYYQGLGGLQWW